MKRIFHLVCLAGIIASQLYPVRLYSQDDGLPESWVNPPPDPEDILTYPFEPNPLTPLVSMGPDGKLVYKAYSDEGDRLLDWSKAGYMQNNVPLPDAQVKDTLYPLNGEPLQVGALAYPMGPDSREMIQDALYRVWQMSPDANGVKGAVLLKAGTYYVTGSLFVPTGVVLRGEGDDENGTVIIFRSVNGGGNAIKTGQGSIWTNWQTAVDITDNYVPSGSYEILVTDASIFQPGDFVYVRKTVNQQWIDDLGCGERLRHIRGGEEGAGKKPWTPDAFQFMHLRQITAVNGNTLTLDVMMPQSIAAVHGGGKVLQTDVSSLSTHCGIESLCVVSNYDTTIKDTGKDANFLNFSTAVSLNNTMDSWVRNVAAKHFYFAAINVGDGTRQITVRDCKYLEPVGPKHGGFRYSFNLGGGTGHLVYNCYAEDGRHDYAGGSRTMGPFAFVNSVAVRGGGSEPHHRWGTGFLFDNVVSKDGAISAFNRGDSGSGHGWAAANTTIWNCDASSIVVFDPETKGENNFAIGYSGDREEFDSFGIYYPNTRAGYWGTPQEGKFYGYALMGSGYIESPAAPVEPGSIFIQQLIDRIGLDQAMRVLDDDKELESRLGQVGLFSAYPNLERINDSTFMMKFNMPVNGLVAGPEHFTVSGNTGHEGVTFTTGLISDSIVKLKFRDIGMLPAFSELRIEAHDVKSLTGKSLEGITTATYVEPDLTPVVSGMTATVNNENGTLEATSTRPGFIYLVRFTEDYNYLDAYKTVADLDQAVAENLGRRVDAPVANTPVTISTQGLPKGFYLYYAVDVDGRISQPADEWPQVEATGPLLGADDASLVKGFSAWSARGTIYIQPDDQATGYSARIFDLTGRLLDASENMMGDQQLEFPGYRGILVVRLILEDGLRTETYKLLHNPGR